MSTFLQLQDAVIRRRFTESMRAEAKDWINYVQGKVLAKEEWTFLHATDDVTVTSGSQTVSGVAADFGIATALLRSDGTPLEPLRDHREFFARYYDNTQTTTGQPEAFTVVGGSILVGPTSNESKTDYKLIYEKIPTALVADSDVSVIPVAFHMILVFGAREIGRKLEGDPTWQSEEAEFEQAIDDMRRFYLAPIRGAARQVPAYTP